MENPIENQLVERLLLDARQPCDGDLLMGFRHYLGQEAAQDYTLALHHFKAAAQDGAPGSAWAEYAIGLMYESGAGVARSLMQADAWFRRAARRGNIAALCALGEVREAASGRPLEAMDLFRLAEESARRQTATAEHIALATVEQSESARKPRCP